MYPYVFGWILLMSNITIPKFWGNLTQIYGKHICGDSDISKLMHVTCSLAHLTHSIIHLCFSQKSDDLDLSQTDASFTRSIYRSGLLERNGIWSYISTSVLVDGLENNYGLDLSVHTYIYLGSYIYLEPKIILSVVLSVVYVSAGYKGTI